MVCAKCEKKLNKVAAPDPFRLSGASSSSSSSAAAGPSRIKEDREVGKNKLLSKKRFQPYGMSANKCKICKSNVSQNEAKYCQNCAYKKGVCAICGKQVLDTTGYKQSSK